MAKIEKPVSDLEKAISTFETLMKNDKDIGDIEGKIVSGKILKIDRDAVVVDIGFKNEGRIPLKEFVVDGKTKLDVVIGDNIDVLVEKINGNTGDITLSKERALLEVSWQKLKQDWKDEINVEGEIVGHVKGGCAARIEGLMAFLPGSQIDVHQVKDIKPLLNLKQSFKILKMDDDQGNIVVSRKAILEEARAGERDKILGNIKEGSVLTGEVKNITDYGAFIGFGFFDGLLHITDLSWKKIAHPSEILTIGEKIKVMVIKYNPDSKRVSLGLKQLEENPWKDFDKEYKVGSKIKGKVTTITDYGVFVEVAPKVEGLVYYTELAWNINKANPKKMLTKGDEVEAIILNIDLEKHRMGLSIKRCQNNPWVKFAEENPVGTVVEGIISSIMEFGIFVTIAGESEENTIDALIPAIEYSYSSNPEAEIAKLKKGEKIKAEVIALYPDRERVTLSVKKLRESDFVKNTSSYKKGDILTVKILSLQKDGIEVEVTENIKSFIKRNDLSKHKTDQRIENFAAGERTDAMVIDVDKKNSTLMLSIKALEIKREEEAIKGYGSVDSGASLGDILGEALAVDNKKTTSSSKKNNTTKEKVEKAPLKESKAKKENISKKE